MEEPTAPPAGAQSGLRCPKCDAPRDAGAAECPACGVIFAKLAAHALGRTPEAAATRRDTSRGGGLKLAAVVATLVLVGGLGALALRTPADAGQGSQPALQPAVDDLVVRYVDGHACVLRDWRFEYRRTYNGGTTVQGGWEVTDLNEYVEVASDRRLRFYSTHSPIDDETLAVDGESIERIRFEYLPADQDSPVVRTVTGIVLDTLEKRYKFGPQDSPSSYRKRFIIPVAPFYFPGHFDHDYTRWRRATVEVVGELDEGCEGYARISLTGDEVPRFAVPAEIEFPAS